MQNRISILQIKLISILCLVLLSAAPQASFADFKLVVIGDVQNHQSQTAALTSSILGMSDVAFVAQMGDLSNSCQVGEFQSADTAFDILDNGNVPYGTCPGNHDQYGSGFCSTINYGTYFGASRYAGKPYFQGSLDDLNHYSFFSAGGMDFIIFFLQYNPGASQYNWANDLMALNPNRRAIVVSHNILTASNGWSNAGVYTNLSGNRNLFLMLCGHNRGANDGEANRTEPRAGMSPVHIIMTDYQDTVYFPNNVLRPFTFKPGSNTITVAHGQGVGEELNLAYNMLYGDVNGIDCDVDGSDLSALIGDYANYTANNRIDLTTFAGKFGKNACQ